MKRVPATGSGASPKRVAHGIVTEASARARGWIDPTHLMKALAHELASPLTVAELELELLEAEGSEVSALRSAAARLQILNAELRLAARLTERPPVPLELRDAIALILGILGQQGRRVHVDLPMLPVRLPPGQLYPLLFALLAAYLDTALSADGVRLTAHAGLASVTLFVTGAAPSTRMRFDVLGLLAGADGNGGAEQPLQAVKRLAALAGVDCHSEATSDGIETRLELPWASSCFRLRASTPEEPDCDELKPGR